MIKRGLRDSTIVLGDSTRHKAQSWVAALVAITVTVSPSTVWAQDSEESRAVQFSQVLSLGASSLLYLTPDLIGLNDHPPACAPCDPANVPWFDRVAIRKQSRITSDLSTLLELGLAGFTLVDLGFEGGGRASAMSLEATMWTAAITEWSKTLIGRKRPVLYTPRATDASSSLDNQRSMPSGHTAVAFSLATSYVLYMKDHRETNPASIVAGATAVTIGALRVIAGRHFPSDVLVGAILGTAMGAVAYHVRY